MVVGKPPGIVAEKLFERKRVKEEGHIAASNWYMFWLFLFFNIK